MNYLYFLTFLFVCIWIISVIPFPIGVDQNDREARKVQSWRLLAEAKEAESDSAPPSFLEIPSIFFHGENDGFGSGHTPGHHASNVHHSFGMLNIGNNNDDIIVEENEDGSPRVMMNDTGQYEL